MWELVKLLFNLNAIIFLSFLFIGMIISFGEFAMELLKEKTKDNK